MRIAWFAGFRNVIIILLRCRHFGALPTRLSAALAKQNVSKVLEHVERPRGEKRREGRKKEKIWRDLIVV